MKSRSLLILAVVAVLVVAAAIGLSLSRHDSAQPEATLYPQLGKQLDKVTAIRLYGPGNQRKVALEHAGSEWRVSERFNYPAATDKVRQLLLDLSEAKLVEEKTANAANYSALGVEDVSAKAATGSRLELVGVQNVDLIVGKNGAAMNARYVRKNHEQKSWLIDRTLDAPAEPKEWLEPHLLDIAANRIRSAHIEVEGKQPYTAVKAKREEANFLVNDLKKGQVLNSDSAANGVGSALASLTLTDVAPIAQWQNKAPQAKATYTTFEGITLQLTGWVDGGAHWLAVRVSFDEPTSSDEKDKKPAQDAKTQAASLDARLSAWVFEIPDYKYGTIFAPVEDLLKK